MEKIKGFQISSMTVSGFKCYEAPMEITFGNPTIVTGGNGRGKSSLADAIAFAITGLPFFGERGIDRLHNETNPDLQITMRFTDETGKAHELTRSRQKDRMSITYDGYAIRQTDLNEMFGERDVFLSIFNPLYFSARMGRSCWSGICRPFRRLTCYPCSMSRRSSGCPVCSSRLLRRFSKTGAKKFGSWNKMRFI